MRTMTTTDDGVSDNENNDSENNDNNEGLGVHVAWGGDVYF